MPSSAAALFAEALALLQGGRLSEAEPLYRRILDADPGYFDARHHLGVIHYQRGEHVAAMRQIDAALRINPNVAAAHNNRGAALAALGRFEEAAESYGRAIALEPGYVDALLNRGNALRDLGRFDAALASYDRVVALSPGDPVALTKRGNVLHALGRFAEALASFDRATAVNPDLAEAWNNRGATLAKLGRTDDAVASYDRAIALHPLADAYSNRGLALAELGQVAEALESYERAAALAPADPAIFVNRGLALAELGRLDEAVASYDRAIALKSDDADAFNGRAIVLSGLGRFAEALASCDRAIALKTDNPEAFSNRGNALVGLKRFDEALASYDSAIALKPDFAEAFYNRGNVLYVLKRSDEALASYDRALVLRPDHADAMNNRGNALNDLQRFDEALASFDQAIGFKLDYADAVNNRGNALRLLRRFDETLANYDKAIALKPTHAEYHNNRAIVLAEVKRFDEALASYDKAIALKPDYVDAYNNRGFALRDMRRLDEALASFAQALALKPDYEYLRGTCLHARMHLCDWAEFNRQCADLIAALNDGKAAALPFQILAVPANGEQQLRCARTYGADKYAASRVPVWCGERYGHRRIRVAYLSADLRDHPIAALTSGLFERHDRTRFETVAISFKSDAHNQVRERLSAHFDRFIDAQTMGDAEVAGLVRELEIDIAVDLNGYTEGARSHVFAQRPAPVQVNYLGYAGTLGQSHWDYILADRFVIPEESRAHYAEQVVYLPDCFMVTDRGRRISARTPSRADAGLPDSGFVFCCFNNSFKITPDVFDVWMRLLEAVPGSVLWLSASHASAVVNLRREAERRGVSADRLIFAPRLSSSEDYLARLGLADLFLDTRPYNAHATAADALWAGVPVLTCPGTTFVSRVAGSLIGALGLPELIVGSLAEYEAVALELARNPERLATVRERLARNREVYPLFDTARFARHIEAAYERMWELAERGEPPQGFAIGKGGGTESCVAGPSLNSEQGGRSFVPDEAAIAVMATPGDPPDLKVLLSRAIACHQAGQLSEAEQLYRKVLDANPTQFDCLHLLGMVCCQRGAYAEAVRHIDLALAINPGIAAVHNSRATVLNLLGRFEEAVASSDRAIALDPDHAEAHGNRGSGLLQLGRYSEALASCDKAIALRPNLVAIMNNRGVALKELKRLDEALESWDRAIALDPDSPEAHNNRANILNQLKQYDQALESARQAAAHKPALAEAWYNCGIALHGLARNEEALAGYDKALALCPDRAEYHHNRAVVLAGLNRLDGALASHDKALALKPDYPEAYNNRGLVLRDLKRFEEALASFSRALELGPDLDYLSGTHLHAKMQLCDWTDHERDCAKVGTAVARGAAASFPFQILPWSSDPAMQLQCARRLVEDKYRASTIPLWRGERYAHQRIRVGYLSSDFRDHPVMTLAEGLFTRHDRTRFETVAVSFGVNAHGQTRERLRGLFDRFIDAEGRSDLEIAKLVRGLEIDIAVDLNGFTEAARPSVFAHRPAPVQVNYLGFAGTLGGCAWDYIIADRFVIPDEARAHYAENVVNLPDCFMVNDNGRKISPRTPSRAEAGLPDNGFVFCCFNNSFKITPGIFDIWMRLLGGVDRSVLWLSAANASAVANLRGEAEQRGIAADRLVFASRVPLNEDHLARLRLADLFLDTLPYNAHTTAADALWAGVPVLTSPGETFASRVAGSLLTAIGLPELITRSLAEYEKLALKLAHDPEQLVALREKLARNRDVFALFDTGGFTRHIESAYTTMWERTQRGEPPQSFAVLAAPRAAG